MYDTIVLGNDLGSLVAAVTLARQGGKTLLLADETHSCYSENGYTFDIDPFPWTGFSRGDIFKQLLSHLGITQEDLVVNPPLQIIFRNHRIEISGKENPDLKEINREFPEDESGMLRLYGSIAKSGAFASMLVDKGLHLRPKDIKSYAKVLLKSPMTFIKERSFIKQIGAIRKKPLLGKILDCQILLMSHLDPNTVADISLARTLSVAMPGLSHYREGKHSLIAKLKKKFEADGGIIEKHNISTIEMDKVVKVNVKSEGAVPTLYGKNLIISSYYEDFLSFLSENRGLASTIKKYKRIEPAIYPFTLHLGINENSIPEKMGPYAAVVANAEKPFEDANLLFVETSEKGNTLRAPEGKRAMSITVFLKTPPREAAEHELKEKVNEIFKNLRFFLPFIEDNVDFANIDRSIDISKQYGRLVGPRYRVKNSMVRIGMELLHNRTSMKNVFITGDTVFPGLGFEGEITSALNAARLAAGGDKQ